MKAMLSNRKGPQFNKDTTLHAFFVPAREETPAAP